MVEEQIMDSYKLSIGGVIIEVHIYMEEGDSVPTYNISILNISETTNIILNKLREEFVSRISGPSYVNSKSGAPHVALISSAVASSSTWNKWIQYSS